MYKETKAVTLQGTTEIENQIVVTMYAQKTTRGDITTNISIQSDALYEANKDQCDADIETFKSHVEEL